MGETCRGCEGLAGLVLMALVRSSTLGLLDEWAGEKDIGLQPWDGFSSGISCHWVVGLGSDGAG